MHNTADTENLAKNYIGGLAHVHTRLSNYRGHVESNQSISTVVETLQAEIPEGPLQFIMINEHASNPVHPKRLGKFSLRARALVRKQWLTHISGVPIFHGFEASLLPDGTTDLTDKLAGSAEMVIASRHKLPQEYMTEKSVVTKQLLAACGNSQIDVIGHPLRNIELMNLDWHGIFDTAARTGTAIEVNLNNFPEFGSEPERFAIWREWIKLLGASKCRVLIGSDLHNTEQMKLFIKDWNSLNRKELPNRLREFIMTLAAAGISPERVVNANYSDFMAWLALDKSRRVL